LSGFFFLAANFQGVWPMVEVLSQAQIDELVRAVHSGEVNEEALVDQEISNFRVYDFRKPNKFSKEQTSTFQVIYGNYARSLGTSLSINLRSTFRVSLVSIEQIVYEEYIHSLLDPSLSIIFSMDPLEGSAVLELAPEIVFIMLERLMGGKGRRPPQEFKSLTQIERALIENLSQDILDLSAEAWENVAVFRPKFERIETNPQFVQVVSPTETVLLVSMDIRVDEFGGTLQYILPYIALEPILGNFSTKYWFEKTSRTLNTNYQNRIKDQMKSVKMPVRVILGDSFITVRELLDLQVGDVVLLNRRSGDNLDVMVGSTQKFYARPGLCDDRIGVKIVGVKEESMG
jgi:flagellar motor switch protein FliM